MTTMYRRCARRAIGVSTAGCFRTTSPISNGLASYGSWPWRMFDGARSIGTVVRCAEDVIPAEASSPVRPAHPIGRASGLRDFTDLPVHLCVQLLR